MTTIFKYRNKRQIIVSNTKLWKTITHNLIYLFKINDRRTRGPLILCLTYGLKIIQTVLFMLNDISILAAAFPIKSNKHCKPLREG